MSNQMKRTINWSLLIAVLAVASVTAAAAFASTGPGCDAITEIPAVVLQLALVVLVAAAVLLMRRISAKLSVDVLVRNQDLREMLALRAIAYAEERGYQSLRLGSRLPSPRKLALAIEYVCNSLPAVTDAEAAALVESMLSRVKGAGGGQVPAPLRQRSRPLS